MDDFPKNLIRLLTKRQEVGALRRLKTVDGLADFSSNDYLGLSKRLYNENPKVGATKGNHLSGSTGSRLLSGNSEVFDDAEQNLANIFKVEAATIYNSGYDANLGLFSSVPQREDIVFYDAFVHASIRDGLLMGKAKNFSYYHNDLEDLERKICRIQARAKSQSEIYVVSESVFSMDGDMANLEALSGICKKYSCRLIIDEAHSLGVFGTNGLGRSMELNLMEHLFAVVITFGKAMGSHGAAVLGSQNLKDYLINFSRSFIYTTALPSQTIGHTMAAFDVLMSKEGNEKRQSLKQNISIFNDVKNKLHLNSHFISSTSAIHSCIIQGNSEVKAVSEQLQHQGFDVRPILYPTVPLMKERLRFSLHSYNSEEEIEGVLNKLSEAV